MMPKRYGTRIVRHRPGSGEPSVESTRCKSDHSESVNRGAGVKIFRRSERSIARMRRQPRTFGRASAAASVLAGDVIAGVQLLSHFLDEGTQARHRFRFTLDAHDRGREPRENALKARIDTFKRT